MGKCKVFYNAKCRFVCETEQLEPQDILSAMIFARMGRWVDFYYDGVYVGHIIYKGDVKLVSELPLDDDSLPNGTSYFCMETKNFYIQMPDELYDIIDEVA